MPSLISNLYAFGEFRVDAASRILRRGDEPIALTPKAFDILLLLIQHRGEVVSKDELMQAVWPDSFVEESNLTQTVFMLRKALGESSNQRYILTVQGRGYRSAPEVQTLPSNGNGHGVQAIPPPAAETDSAAVRVVDAQSAGIRARSRAVIIFAVLAVGILVTVLWLLPALSRHASASRPLHAIAVLPLDNFSGDPSQDYFVDGMTDELITDLAKVSSLRVISRTSVMRFKGTKKDLKEIARELQVDGVVEGSVTRSGGRIRITAQLINGSTDQHLWAETYERDLGDVLKLQSNVAQAIAQQVRAQLTPQEQIRLGSAKPVNPEAHEAYLKGRYYFVNELTNPESLRRSKAYFEESIRKDPGFALGYAGLADSYTWLAVFNLFPPDTAYQSAKEALRKSRELDDTVGEAHDTLGVLSWRFDWDWDAAEREFQQSIALAPSYSCAHEDHADFLAFMGRREEALAEIAKSKQIDPGPASDGAEVAAYYQLRNYKALVETSERQVVSNPNDWTGYTNLGIGYEATGKLPQALAAYQRAVELSQGGQDAVASLAHAYAAIGKRAEARKLLNDLQRQSQSTYISPYVIATVYAGLGDKDKAFEFLEKAYRERSLNLSWHINADLRVDNLRSDARFRDLLRRMRLT